jgi:hypothetical protein
VDPKWTGSSGEVSVRRLNTRRDFGEKAGAE